uniref:Leukocyte cell-derived chemotaxin 1 n=1 Tax=Labrus bergylta TaxID=56723 RepID=A0A3Q3G3Z2_9LABR
MTFQEHVLLFKGHDLYRHYAWKGPSCCGKQSIWKITMFVIDFVTLLLILMIMNINGEVREGSVEIDSDNNLERYKTGIGAEETVEIHDFQIGITGIRFFGGDKCYIKSQIKASLPHMGADNKEALMFDEEFLIWVSAEQPLKDTSFLSNKILGLCGELPIYWLQPVSPKVREEEEEEGAHSGGAREEAAMTFDTMLDHQGICCSECQRSYTHCQRVCEPLRGYWPWPYNFRGCQVACRVIMPCRWWVARILGIVI